jgi:dienelactone hydrolase
MIALLVGRTLLGERVHDVSCAIDLLEARREVDASRIGVVGNSGGGTASYYAACVEPRIAAAMPGCSVCTYADSIGRIDHCCDNYLPGALRSFDMSDLAGLIAPRPLVVVAGRDDPLFPIDAVRACYGEIGAIYAAAGADDVLAYHEGAGGHRFFAEAWEQFARVTGW